MRPGTMNKLTEFSNMDQQPHMIKHAESKCQMVEESFIPGLEDETFEVQHLLAEPKSDNDLVDGVLCCSIWDPEKNLKMENFSSEFDYGWKMSCGSLDHGEGDNLKLEVLDGLLYEVDEVDGIHAAHDPSSVHEDFLLDIELPEKFHELDYGPFEGSQLGTSGSESGTPEFSGDCNTSSGISESLVATVPGPDCKDGFLEKTTNNELRQYFGSKSMHPVPVMDVLDPAKENYEKLDMSDDDEKPLANLIWSNKKGNCSVKVTINGSPIRQKRLCKPIGRNIDEFSRAASSASNAQCLKVKSYVERCQVPSQSWVLRERPKKNVAELEPESDHELSASDSEEYCKRKRSKACHRRKHQRMWTLPEVIKLVDGISQFGVGRWTDIKRLLFSSSDYRTPIDLRDKWRNLLRSSYLYAHNKKVERDGKRTASPLPKHLAHRIGELADAHPYPGVRCLKKSKQSSAAKDPPVSTCTRNLRRRK